MARGALDNIETEGDFALGMGIAIGMFIALFAVGIALFVIQQGAGHSSPQAKEPGRGASALNVPPDSSPGTTPARAPR